MNCTKCNDVGYTFGKPIFPNGREKVVCECKKTEKLSPSQIENWRRVLLGQIGPYALFMSEEDIQKVRDVTQEKADNI